MEAVSGFDVIWISHVFEHLVKPLDLLKKLHTNLADNGVIFIEVPDCENKDILNLSIFNHLSSFHFSKDNLIELAKKS